MAAQQWFKILGKHKVLFDLLTDEQAGRVIKAAMAYFDTGEAQSGMEKAESIVFSALKSDIGRGRQNGI